MRMPLLGNLINAIAFTKLLFKDPGRYVLLVILDLIPIVNLIIILGYGAKTIKETPNSSEPPPLKGFGSLWASGLRIFTVILVYALVPAIFLGIAAASLAVPQFTIGYQGMVPRLPLGLLMGSLTAGLVLAFVAALILAVAVVHMVKTEHFASAFDLRQIVVIIGKIGWGQYVLWTIVMFLLFLLAGGLSRIPVVGFLVWAALSPLLTIFVSRSIGLLYSETTSVQQVQSQTPNRFCIQCGSALPSNGSFCPSCGYRMGE